MKKEKKAKRNPGKVLLCILLVIVMLLLGLSVFHLIRHDMDMKYLAEKGYYDPVSVGEHALNVMQFGNENGKGKIVVLSGMGAGLSVELRQMAKELETDYRFVYVGRAGWDGSDDTKDDRSAEVIVEEYRQALKASGVEAPYTLLAHSMGGVYASYWVSKYPAEIKGFVNIDGTYVEAIPEDEMQAGDPGNLGNKLLVNLGIGDILLPALLRNDSGLSKEDWRIYCILQLLSISSDAVAKEGSLINRNRNAVWEALTQTEVPKLYISARDGDLTDAVSKEANEKELVPYLEKMGNYEISYLPGSHFIYKTEAEKCKEIIKEFLNRIYE